MIKMEKKYIKTTQQRSNIKRKETKFKALKKKENPQ